MALTAWDVVNTAAAATARTNAAAELRAAESVQFVRKTNGQKQKKELSLWATDQSINPSGEREEEPSG